MIHHQTVIGCRLPARVGITIGGLLFAFALPRCAPTTTTPNESLPTLADLREARGKKPASSGAVRDSLRTKIRRVDLPLDAPIGSAWDLVTEGPIGTKNVARWRRNGFRVGILPTEQRPAFLAALGSVHGHHQRVAVGKGTPVILATSRGDLPSINVFLDANEVGEHRTTIAGGSARLLLQIRDLEQGQPFLELFPDHHVPPRQLFPPPGPHTKDATWPPGEGKQPALRSLALTVPLGQGGALVIGASPSLGKPSPEVTSPREGDTETPDQNASEDQDVAETEMPTAPTLGIAILLARRFNHPIQSIYLVDRPTR